MKKLTKKVIKETMLNEGKVILDEGNRHFIVTQINENNFEDITPKLKKQLEDEGKYNTWISFVTSFHEKPYTIESLPIYGNPNEYVTKYFENNIESAIDQCLNDSKMKITKRANDYLQITK